MPDLMKPLLLSVLLVAGGAALAQETAAPETTPEATPETPTETTPEDTLSMGSPLDQAEPAAPLPGQAYIRETSGDWSLRCLKGEEEGAAEPCQLYQLLQDDQGNNVAEFSIFPLQPGGRAAAGATIVAPLETLLTENLTIAVDGSAAREYPFTFCNPAGCVARVGFTEEELTQFRRGNAATLRMVPVGAPDQPVVLTVSLSGFTAGFEQATPPGQ